MFTSYKVYISVINFISDSNQLDFGDFKIISISQGQEAKCYRELIRCKGILNHVLIQDYNNYQMQEDDVSGVDGIINNLNELLLIFRLFKTGDIIFADSLFEDKETGGKSTNRYSLDRFSILKYRFTQSEIVSFNNFKNNLKKKIGFNNKFYNFSLNYFTTGINKGFCINLESLERIVDYFIALESLFLMESERENLTEIISNRISNFLKVKDAIKIVKYFYNIRSRVVHGDYIFKSECELKKKIEEVKIKLPEFENLIRQIFIKFFDYNPKNKNEFCKFLNKLYTP